MLKESHLAGGVSNFVCQRNPHRDIISHNFNAPFPRAGGWSAGCQSPAGRPKGCLEQACAGHSQESLNMALSAAHSSRHSL
jgi:hypothetical protein